MKRPASRPVDAMAAPAPVEITWLVEPIGPAAALALIEAFGGTRIHIPKQPRPTSQLVRCIGVDAASALARALAPSEISVPLVKFWRARLYALAGMTYREIALAIGSTEGTVHRHLQNAKLTAKVEQLEMPF